eukprot:g1719.t1
MASWQQNLPHQAGVSIRPGPYDTTQTASAPAYEAQPPHATVQQQHFLGGKNPGYLHHPPGGFLQPPQIAGKPTYSSPPYAPAQYSVGGAASSMMPGGVGTVAPHQQMAGKMNTMAPIGTKGTAADPHMGGAPGMYNQHQFAAQQHLQGNSSSTLYNGGGGGQHAVRSGNANKSKGSFFGTGKGSTKGKKGGTNYRDTSPELNHRRLGGKAGGPDGRGWPRGRQATECTLVAKLDGNHSVTDEDIEERISDIAISGGFSVPERVEFASGAAVCYIEFPCAEAAKKCWREVSKKAIHVNGELLEFLPYQFDDESCTNTIVLRHIGDLGEKDIRTGLDELLPSAVVAVRIRPLNSDKGKQTGHGPYNQKGRAFSSHHHHHQTQTAQQRALAFVSFKTVSDAKLLMDRLAGRGGKLFGVFVHPAYARSQHDIKVETSSARGKGGAEGSFSALTGQLEKQWLENLEHQQALELMNKNMDSLRGGTASKQANGSASTATTSTGGAPGATATETAGAPTEGGGPSGHATGGGGTSSTSTGGTSGGVTAAGSSMWASYLKKFDPLTGGMNKQITTSPHITQQETIDSTESRIAPAQGRRITADWREDGRTRTLWATTDTEGREIARGFFFDDNSMYFQYDSSTCAIVEVDTKGQLKTTGVSIPASTLPKSFPIPTQAVAPVQPPSLSPPSPPEAAVSSFPDRAQHQQPFQQVAHTDNDMRSTESAGQLHVQPPRTPSQSGYNQSIQTTGAGADRDRLPGGPPAPLTGAVGFAELLALTAKSAPPARGGAAAGRAAAANNNAFHDRQLQQHLEQYTHYNEAPAPKQDTVPEASESESEEMEMSEDKPVICEVCQRKFPNRAALVRHENESELHKENLRLRALQPAAGGATVSEEEQRGLPMAMTFAKAPSQAVGLGSISVVLGAQGTTTATMMPGQGYNDSESLNSNPGQSAAQPGGGKEWLH